MNLASWFSPEASAALSLTLVHSLWQVSLAVVTLWCIGRIWGRMSVERSYALHVAALVICLIALPVTFATLYSPQQTGVTRSQPVPDGKAVRSTTAIESTPLPQPIPPGGDALAAFSSDSSPLVVEQPSGPVASLRDNWWLDLANWTSGAYVLGVLIMLLRLARSIYRTERLRSQAQPITAGPLAQSLERLAREFALPLRCTLASSSEVLVPTVVGFVKPTILLPASALTGLSASELEMILVHELAHVRRYDLWVNLVQRLAEVVLFFNPALWYLSRRIATLREYCCDELTCRQAATSTSEPRVEYATTLLRVLELARPETAHADLAALAATGRTPSELRRRVARLFGEPLTEPVRLSRGGMWLVGVMLLLCCGVFAQSQSGGDDQNTAEKDFTELSSSAEDDEGGKAKAPDGSGDESSVDVDVATSRPTPAIDPERIKYLKEVVESRRHELSVVEVLVRTAHAPQNEGLLAQYQLAKAEAELATAQGRPEEVVKHYAEAVKAAERMVATHEAVYNAGVIPMDTLLISKRRLAEVKDQLSMVKRAMVEAKNTSAATEASNSDAEDEQPDTERIKYLEEIAESYRKELAVAEVQFRQGERTQREVLLVEYALATAAAQLAEAKGAAEEVVQQREAAVAALQKSVKLLEMMYQHGGVVTYTEVLQAKRQLLEAKEKLRLAKQTLEQKDAKKSTRATSPVPMFCVDADGNGVAGAEVYVFQHTGGDDGEYEQFGPFTTNAEGHAECAEAVFTSDVGNFDRFYYARLPGKLVGVSRSANWKNRSTFNVEGKVEMRPSRTIDGKVNVPEGFDPTSVKVVVRSLNVRTGPGELEFKMFPRHLPFATLDTALPQLFETIPDSNGAFRMHDIPVERGATLVTEARGLAEAQWYNRDGENTKGPIELNCVPESVLTGKITTPDGSPAAGIEVTARIQSGMNRSVGFETTFRTVTDAEGRYELGGLPEWDLVMSVRDPQDRWIACPSEPFFLSPGSSETLDLQLEDGVMVSGRVTDPEGAPVEGAAISALVSNNLHSGVAGDSTDADGRYTLRMPSGTYELYFNSLPPGFAYPDPQIVRAFAIRKNQAAIDNMDFTLERGTEEAKPATNTVPSDTRDTLKSLLETMALVHGYALDEDQVVGRVAPPFPPLRAEWYRLERGTEPDSNPPTSMTFRWDGDTLTSWGMSFNDPDNPGYTLSGLMNALVNIKPQQMDGPAELLDRRLPGDWVIRPGADRQEVIAQIEAILREEFDMKVKLEFREVQREVYVVSGRYHYSPLEDQVDEEPPRRGASDPIQVFGTKTLPEDFAGNGLGDFDKFLRGVGDWINTPIVNELEVPTQRRLTWKFYRKSPHTNESHRQNHDPVTVLRTISRQTGLEFTKDRRKVELLFVEPE
ncbi:carboxypeptidase regulatory-like domain-containing protein [Aeoliella sp. ICT_H6.2]|uniref:Carboxypeptidase regulatory-like domain-containing protein n=1 Tax=Aeoliella straminimaris TaxID=2954799 RepID=A0A9X2FJ22_9BACT|nr:M56 family metallopeptidase [Aeoliella straminimaris]MCO6047736.1 carboxypeptidase regulatory-like domain-containing protein [Aeoliella straminimaris]